MNAEKFSAICIVNSSGEEVTEISRVSSIGLKSDVLPIPFDSSDEDSSLLAYAKANYAHAHGDSFVAPDHDDSMELTAGAVAWSETGTLVEIIAADLIEDAFDIHLICVSGISENSEIQIDLYAGASGSEEIIGSVVAVRNAVQSQEGSVRVQIPRQEEGTRITARLCSGTSNATTVNIKLIGHVYG